MTGKSTATVETLTAEVRVLMVGSRQVTLSVYGQLDWIGSDDIEPFGRVRPRDAKYGYVYLIGRHPESGALVRASAPVDIRGVHDEIGGDVYRQRWETAEREAERLDAEAERHENWCGQVEGNVAFASSAGQVFENARQARDQAAAQLRNATAIRDEYARVATPYLARAAELNALPLIVLAGLR